MQLPRQAAQPPGDRRGHARGQLGELVADAHPAEGLRSDVRTPIGASGVPNRLGITTVNPRVHHLLAEADDRRREAGDLVDHDDARAAALAVGRVGDPAEGVLALGPGVEESHGGDPATCPDVTGCAREGLPLSRVRRLAALRELPVRVLRHAGWGYSRGERAIVPVDEKGRYVDAEGLEWFVCRNLTLSGCTWLIDHRRWPVLELRADPDPPERRRRRRAGQLPGGRAGQATPGRRARHPRASRS